MIRTIWKKQRRDIESIHQRPLVLCIVKKIFGIVIDDVMTAKEMYIFQEVKQVSLLRRMKRCTIIPDCTYVMNLMVG